MFLIIKKYFYLFSFGQSAKAFCLKVKIIVT